MPLYENLLQQQSARDFLKLALQLQYARTGRINLSDFSRRAGFASRSFISEYLAGKKKLSRDSLAQITTALKIPKDYLRLFTLFVQREQPELLIHNHKVTDQDVQKCILALRSKAMSAQHIVQHKTLLGKRSLLLIYSALGTIENGAEISEITARTGLSRKSVSEGLHALLASQAIDCRDNRYFAKSSQIDVLSLKTSELAQLSQDMCQEIAQQAPELVEQENSFLFYSAISVNSYQLPEIKKKLREAVYDILDQYQSDDGNTVQQLFLCLKK